MKWLWKLLESKDRPTTNNGPEKNMAALKTTLYGANGFSLSREADSNTGHYGYYSGNPSLYIHMNELPELFALLNAIKPQMIAQLRKQAADAAMQADNLEFSNTISENK